MSDRKIDTIEKYGMDESKMRTVQLQLERLRSQGVLVDLNISGTSMFTRAASWAELGIFDADDVRRQRFTKGSKYLISETQVKRLKSIETRMRQLLDKYSFDVTGFRPYRWIPFTAYEDWQDKWNAQVDQFNTVKADIIQRYDFYTTGLKDDFALVGERAWRTFTGQGYESILVDGRKFTNEKKFVKYVVEKALAKLPSVDDIKSGLHADYITALVYGESDVEADRLHAEKLRTEIAAEKAKQAEGMLDLDMKELDRKEKSLKIAAMREAEMEHARKRIEEVGSPFEEVFGKLRARFAQDCDDMLESIKKNGMVRGKIAEKGAGLLELYSVMAAHDDNELRNKLVELKSAIGPVGEGRDKETPDRNVAEVEKALEEIAKLSAQTASDLAAEPTRAAFVELE